MIKSNELRIGNIVNHIYDTIQIESVSGDSVNLSAADMGGEPYIEGIDCKDIEPIPLTAEWLERLGFVEDEEQRLKPVATYYHLTLPVNGDNKNEIFANIINPEFIKEGNNYACYVTNDQWSSNNIIYVHQLQNLYFALTGKELETKK